MGSAFFWGLVGGVSLVIGAAAVYVIPIHDRVLGAIMAFGAGVLISAVAFELVDEAARTTDGDWAVAVGLFAGAMTFFIGDYLIDRAGGKDRKSSRPQSGGDDSGAAILLGTVLDGIPESIVIGVGLIGGAGVSAAMVAAVFISNIPEAISSTSGLRASGWSARRLFSMWAGVTLIAALSSLAGFALFDSAPDELVSGVEAFAGGALLTMLADTMMPEAFELDGATAGLLTTFGFGLAYAISAV
ncbi:MAG: ZIP family metal transporter [Solirubrobacterales bacterium]